MIDLDVGKMIADASTNFDLMTRFVDCGLELLAHKILEYLDLLDLRCCQLVSSTWNEMVERLYDHHECLKVGELSLELASE